MSAPLQDALLLSLASIVVGMMAGAVLSHWWRSRTQRLDAPAATPAARSAAVAPAAPMARVAPALPQRRTAPAGDTPLAAPPLVPRRPGPAAPGAGAAGPPLPRAADLLLVDDSAVARAKLRRLFELQGYAVHLARDGVEALALLAKGRYALLITDLEMPNMDGVELIRTCLAQPATARMPILAISGHESLRAKFNECSDICGIHRKPWVDDILLSHVAALVGTRRLQALERVA